MDWRSLRNGNIWQHNCTEYPLTYCDEPVSGTPTATYTYAYGDDSWGDLLTAYNGVPRTYDEIGNLLSDGTWTYTWQNGRELASMTDGMSTWSYVYDGNGMRISRTNGTKTYNYVYNGSQLTQMTVGNDTLHFTYGVLGPTTVTWNGTTYYYALNAQGDVIGIYDEDGNLVVVYNWDNAWGYNPIPDGKLAGNSPLSFLGVRGHTQVHKTKKRPPLCHTKVAVNFDTGVFECISSPVRDFDIFYALAVVICKKWKKGQTDRMGKRIAQLRRSRGLSQAKLAKALGLSTSTIAMYEQGRREPSVSVLIALAAVLDVTADYLLTGQPPQSPTIDNAHLITTILSTAWHIGK